MRPESTSRTTSIASSVRAPRDAKSCPSHSNSSGIHDSPAPRATRSPASAATDATVFATSSGWRTGSFSTHARNPIVDVAAAMNEMATHGSVNGVSGPQNREPSAEYGYEADTSSG